MTIIASDVKFYKAATNNDLAGNGGRISATEIVDDTLNNLFPNVSSAERVAGLTRYRKMFLRNENVEDLILYHTDLWVGTQSVGEDYFRAHTGDDTDIQSASELYTDWAGSGVLDSPGVIADPTIDVDYDAADGVFDGAEIYITDGVNSEENEVNGAPVWLGTVATLTLVTALGNNYAAGTKVGTMIDLGNVAPTQDSWTETSALGTYDETTYPLTLFNVGSVTDSWTFTFTDGTNFGVVGAQTGSLGAGDINTNFKPSNGSSYYFELDKDGWGGSWAHGDTITFDTVAEQVEEDATEEENQDWGLCSEVVIERESSDPIYPGDEITIRWYGKYAPFYSSRLKNSAGSPVTRKYYSSKEVYTETVTFTNGVTHLTYPVAGGYVNNWRGPQLHGVPYWLKHPSYREGSNSVIQKRWVGSFEDYIKICSVSYLTKFYTYKTTVPEIWENTRFDVWMNSVQCGVKAKTFSISETEGPSGPVSITVVAKDYVSDVLLESVSIWVDGVYKGKTDVNGELAVGELAAGDHTIKMTKSGYVTSDEDDLDNDDFTVSS